MLTSKVFMAFDLYSSKVIMSSGITSSPKYVRWFFDIVPSTLMTMGTVLLSFSIFYLF